MKRVMSVGPLALVALAGCLASKSDIQLLQDEFRTTRALVAAGDTTLFRANEARRQQIAQVSAMIDRMNDSLRVLATRFAAFQAATSGEFDLLEKQIGQMQERLGQTTRNLQETRAQVAALREQTMTASSPTPPPAGVVDTSQRPPVSGPGPATLFTTAYQQLRAGNYHTARNGFDQLLSTYPMAQEAPSAQLWVGEAYKNEGNTVAADSVYQLVATRYPQAPEAASALYRHGKLLWDAGKRTEARPIFQRVIKEYASSDEARQAKALLGER